MLHQKIRAALYCDEGVAIRGIEAVIRTVGMHPEIELTPVTATEIREGVLDSFAVLVITGGRSHGEAIGLLEAGEEQIRSFVASGGGYLGICAGAHLATVAHDWTVGLINAKKVIEGEWRRGSGMVDLELTPEGRQILGETKESVTCRYHNGIIFRPGERTDLPPYTVAAYFRSEVSENGTTPGAMRNTPAAAYAQYKQGKVFIFSPHPEDTPGLEGFIPRAISWLAER